MPDMKCVTCYQKPYKALILCGFAGLSLSTLRPRRKNPEDDGYSLASSHASVRVLLPSPMAETPGSRMKFYMNTRAKDKTSVVPLRTTEVLL